MTQRLISAAVLVPVVVIFFVLGAPWLTIGIAILAALAAYETAQLVRKAGFPGSTWMPVVAAPVLVLAFAWVVGPERLATAWTIVAPGIALVLLVAALLAFQTARSRRRLQSLDRNELRQPVPGPARVRGRVRGHKCDKPGRHALRLPA